MRGRQHFSFLSHTLTYTCDKCPPAELTDGPHYSNCVGAWGGGIAKAFAERYRDAYLIQLAHCKRSTPDKLVGTALLIAPRAGARRQHYVGCLFTSRRYGNARDPPERILQATGPAMKDLMWQISAEMARGVALSEIRMCRINSGLFAVPWDKSKRALEALQFGPQDLPEDADLPQEIVVYNPQ